MKPLSISDPHIILAFQDEIRRSDEARYDHRLHSILLVAQGMTCPEVAKKLGDSSRTVQYWVHRFEDDGFSGLADADHTGRPKRISRTQLKEIDSVLRKSPTEAGLQGNLWDGKTLSLFIKNKYAVTLGVRQCQRLFRQLGFRLRKPRPLIAHADASKQKEFKKNSGNSQKIRT